MAKDPLSGRWIDFSIVAPILGFVMLVPPVIGLFAVDARLFGAPVILVYLFAVWLALIGVAAVIGLRLARADSQKQP